MKKLNIYLIGLIILHNLISQSNILKKDHNVNIANLINYLKQHKKASLVGIAILILLTIAIMEERLDWVDVNEIESSELPPEEKEFLKAIKTYLTNLPTLYNDKMQKHTDQKKEIDLLDSITQNMKFKDEEMNNINKDIQWNYKTTKLQAVEDFIQTKQNRISCCLIEKLFSSDNNIYTRLFYEYVYKITTALHEKASCRESNIIFNLINAEYIYGMIEDKQNKINLAPLFYSGTNGCFNKETNEISCLNDMPFQNHTKLLKILAAKKDLHSQFILTCENSVIQNLIQKKIELLYKDWLDYDQDNNQDKNLLKTLLEKIADNSRWWQTNKIISPDYLKEIEANRKQLKDKDKKSNKSDHQPKTLIKNIAYNSSRWQNNPILSPDCLKQLEAHKNQLSILMKIGKLNSVDNKINVNTLSVYHLLKFS
jgi:hypothetical protein